MVKNNMRFLSVLNGLADGLLNLLAYFLAYWLRFNVVPSEAFQPFSNYLDVGLLNVLLTVGLYFIFRLYAPKRLTRYSGDISAVLRANLLDILLLGLMFFVRREFDFSRWMLVFYFVLSTVLVLGKHLSTRLILQYVRRHHRNLRHVLIIGNGALAGRYFDSVVKNPHLGYAVAGFVGVPDKPTDPSLDKVTRMGTLDELDAILVEHHAFDEAIIALDDADAAYTRQAIEPCNRAGQRFSIIPYFSSYIFSAAAPRVDNIGLVQVYDICASPLDNPMSCLVKRTVDILASLLGLLLVSPVLLIAAIGVKLSSRGPVFFAQERVGLDKRTFKMYKFRSMRLNAEEHTGWSKKGDPRVTGFGRFIRKTSIDELPQLFNVLKGDMSLVGPRPEVPFHVNHFKDEIPYYMARHQIRPGITGYAQVNGYRGDTSIKERINHDLYYIYNWTLALDIEIIFKTAFGGMLER